jgi:hypothetical protein
MTSACCSDQISLMTLTMLLTDRDLRSNQLCIVLRGHVSTLFNNVADDVMLIDVAPQMDAHGLLAVEQRVGNATDLAEDHVRNGPCVRVLLKCANVEADRLLDNVVLAVWNEE